MKKLIPALSMLLIAATLLGTSTFAWFSMNTEVKATTMDVTAQSNSKYLQIAPGDMATASQFGPSATAQTSSGTLNLTFPVVVKANTDVTLLTVTDFGATTPAGGYYYKVIDGDHLVAVDEIKAGTDISTYYKATTFEPHTNRGKEVAGPTSYWLVEGNQYKQVSIPSGQTWYVPPQAQNIVMALVGKSENDGKYTGDTVKYFTQTSDAVGAEVYTETSKSGWTVQTYKSEMGTDFKVVVAGANPAVDGIIKPGEAGKCYVASPDTMQTRGGETVINYYKLPKNAAKDNVLGQVAWFTANSTNPDEVQETAEAVPCATNELDTYCLSNTFTMKAGGTAAISNLKMSSVDITGAKGVFDDLHDAIRVLCVATKLDGEGTVTRNSATFDAATPGTITYGDSGSALFATISDSDIVEVQVYIYFDGTDTVAKTSNMIATFVNYKFEVNFTID